MATSKMGMHVHEGFSTTEPESTAAAVEGAGRTDDVNSEDIQFQLDKILASHSFRNSKRHKQFLRFVVEMAQTGRHSEIKERRIGIEIFDRPPDYDLATDSIVRGAAVELRKRIAQYYAEPDHADELRLELPLGTYVPVFHWPRSSHQGKQDLAVLETGTKLTEDTIAPAVAHDRSLHARGISGWSGKTRIIASGCILALVAMGAMVSVHRINEHSARRSLDAFWAPLMNGGDLITVCVGDLNYLFKAPPLSNQLKLPQTAGNLLNPNAGAALLRVGSILGSRGKRSTLRLADLTALNDLRQQPVIFIGGMNNPWTQRILARLRFRLTNRPGGIDGDYSLVIDEKKPTMESWRIDINAPLSSIARDYSLVTRLNDPLTGEPVVVLCGLGPYGTAAASEFVSNPDYFSEFSKRAPRDWETKNIQIVLETTVVDGRVSVPRVVAEQVY